MKRRGSTTAFGILFLGVMAGLAQAATYQVTNSGDTATGGTLRWAIKSATTNPGLDLINFNLSSTTISPTGALPSLSDLDGSVVIDGTTQPGYSGTPIVKLVGTNAGSTDGLYVNTPSNVVRGLIITRFQGSGIGIVQGHNVIAGNYVVSNNQHGVYLQSSAHENTIGGTDLTNRNVISGNRMDGVYMYGDVVVDNAVLGNYIGVDPTGLLNNSNSWWGVVVMAPSNRIGSAAGGRNVISANGYDGISMSDHHNIVQGNYVGVNASGTTALGNGISGIQLASASNNTIGGSMPGEGNVFSGHVNFGIDFQPGCHSNTVLGNYIGTDATGNSNVSNKYDGISISVDCGGNQIGGAYTGGCNIISGNGHRGILIAANTGLVIRGNFIGISAGGGRLGNGMEGIFMSDCREITVGGADAGARNFIGGNSMGIEMDRCVSNTVQFNYIGLNEDGVAVSNNTDGILVDGGAGHEISDNVVSGNGTHGVRLRGTPGCALKRNLIGTDPTGTGSRGNDSFGLYLENGASNAVIGGRWADEGNVISGNDLGGVEIKDLTTRNNILRGNRIGSDVSGMTAVPNRSSGIELVDSPSNTIGSATNGNERNVISGNSGQGIQVTLSNSFGNVIAGNYIGTDATGTNRLPNVGSGIWFYQASSNVVGGAGTGAVNRIAYNAGDGIQVQSGDGNLLFNNAIYRNGVLGIDLGLGTPTTNDPGDRDVGPNRLQNYPVLLSVSNSGSQIRVAWTLDSVPNQQFVIEFYGSTGPDPTTYGEGEYSLGSLGPVTMPPTGLLAVTNLLATPNPPPNFITAVASHFILLDSSEFSRRIMLDSDNDGMPDGYETIYFGGYTNGQPNAHGDSDGISNIEEFWADTNPLDSNSFPHIKSIVISNNSCVVIAPCSLERNYEVQNRKNLNVATQEWTVTSASLKYEGDDGRFGVGNFTNRGNFRIISKVP